MASYCRLEIWVVIENYLQRGNPERGSEQQLVPPTPRRGGQRSQSVTVPKNFWRRESQWWSVGCEKIHKRGPMGRRSSVWVGQQQSVWAEGLRTDGRGGPGAPGLPQDPVDFLTTKKKKIYEKEIIFFVGFFAMGEVKRYKNELWFFLKKKFKRRIFPMMSSNKTIKIPVYYCPLLSKNLVDESGQKLAWKIRCLRGGTR